MLRIDDYFWVGASHSPGEADDVSFRSQRLLEFGASSSYEAALIIYFLGFADIVDGSGKVLAKQRRNYGILGAPRGTGSKKAFLSASVNVGLDLEATDSYLQKSYAQQSYYRELALEVLHYARRTKLGQHSLAFLHIYRLLERISYVFPITYALRSDNFKGTYESFKSFIKGDKTGELKFFQNFQQVIIDESVRRASMKFDFQSLPFGGEAAGYKLIKKHSSADHLITETANVDVTLQGQGILELFVNLRNRFFHAGSGHTDNISMIDLPDPDGFFGRINDNILNWISIVYFQTLISKSDRYA